MNILYVLVVILEGEEEEKRKKKLRNNQERCETKERKVKRREVAKAKGKEISEICKIN